MECINWKELPFGYMKTDYNVRCYFQNGEWSFPKETNSEEITLHMAATCLHYGQECFDGLKAYRGKDNKIRIFRMKDSAKRMQLSCEGIMMEKLPINYFEEAVKKVVKLNQRFIPPYGTGASLYIRPFLIGTSPQVGVKPSKDYQFVVFVTPVGPYFKEGFKPIPVIIMRNYDRAAPLGTGKIKVGGNYAASLLAAHNAHLNGYSSVLYLDAKTKKYIDECGQANFYGIRDNTYITPDSNSILPSITNDSLMTIAQELGLKVEKRKVLVEELETFEEAGQIGTAAVITPIQKIVDIECNKIYQISNDGEAGPVTKMLYNKLRSIQLGDSSDNYGWITIL